MVWAHRAERLPPLRNSGASSRDSDNLTWNSGTFAYDSSGNIKSIGNDQYISVAYDAIGDQTNDSTSGTADCGRFPRRWCDLALLFGPFNTPLTPPDSRRDFEA